jgi:general stress protein 26
VSVAGIAEVTQDRNLIKELYKPDWKAWFGDEGGEMNGGPDDPRLALIVVEAQSVEYMKVNKPRPVVLFEVAKSMVTGTPPKVGEERTLTDRELRTEAAREQR